MCRILFIVIHSFLSIKVNHASEWPKQILKKKKESHFLIYTYYKATVALCIKYQDYM